MDVFLIPIGRDRYELYCEPSSTAPVEVDGPQKGIFARLRHRFSVMLHAAEERQRSGPDGPDPEPATWWARLQARSLGWVAERIAEQRLLWNLRGVAEAVAVHPQDLGFDEAMLVIRRILQSDYERHRVWLVVDTLGLVGVAVLALLPGPNLFAYFFAFRVVGHWLSMRGAAQGLRRIVWMGRACPPLTELREAAAMEPVDRQACVDEIATRLSLPSLPAFFERVAIPRP